MSPITLHDGATVRMVAALTWGDAAAFLGGPPRAYALADDEGGLVLMRGDIPHAPVPLRRSELVACTVPVVVVPEDRLDGEGGQCLPDRYSEEPTLAARLEVAERELAQVRQALDTLRRRERAVSSVLTEFTEIAATLIDLMPRNAPGRVFELRVTGLAVDARQALRLGSGE